MKVKIFTLFWYVFLTLHFQLFFFWISLIFDGKITMLHLRFEINMHFLVSFSLFWLYLLTKYSSVPFNMNCWKILPNFPPKINYTESFFFLPLFWQSLKHSLWILFRYSPFFTCMQWTLNHRWNEQTNTFFLHLKMKQILQSLACAQRNKLVIFFKHFFVIFIS